MKYLEPDELKKLLEVAAKSKRNTAMILLSYRHGLRAAELCGLTLADVDEENGRLIVTARKKRKKGGEKFFESFAPKDGFGQSDLTVLHAWIKERAKNAGAESDALFLSRDGGALGPRYWTIAFKIMANAAGLPKEKQHPHVLRHTTAMRAIEGGAPLHMVAAVLRHKSLASLSPYVSPTQSAVDAAKFKAFSKF